MLPHFEAVQEETRDPAILKLFFGGDQRLIAAAQVEAHRRQLDVYEDLAARAGDEPRQGRRWALEYGLAFERMALDFWSRVAHGDKPGQPGQRQA